MDRAVVVVGVGVVVVVVVVILIAYHTHSKWHLFFLAYIYTVCKCLSKCSQCVECWADGILYGWTVELPRRVTALLLAVQFLNLYDALDLQRRAYRLANCLRLWVDKAWRVLLPLSLSQGPCAEPNCWARGLVRSFSLLCGFPRFPGATPLIPLKACYYIISCSSFLAKPIMWIIRGWDQCLANTIRHRERW